MTGNPGVGDPPNLASGGKTGQAKHGINYLISQDPGASYDDVNHKVVSQYGENSPRVIVVGLFDPGHGIRPQWHTYVDYACEWEPIPDDGLERYSEGKPR